jgi:hypothetical protein
MKRKSILAAAIVSLAPSFALGAKIVAEKNCSVRLDGEFELGSKPFVLKKGDPKKAKIAQLEILKSKDGASLAKVIKGNKCCITGSDGRRCIWLSGFYWKDCAKIRAI